jgi:hypothetical protein
MTAPERGAERDDFPARLDQALDAQIKADVVYEDVVAAMDRHQPYAMIAIETFRQAFDASGMSTWDWVRFWLGALSERKKVAKSAPMPGQEEG